MNDHLPTYVIASNKINNLSEPRVQKIWYGEVEKESKFSNLYLVGVLNSALLLMLQRSMIRTSLYDLARKA